MVYIYRGSMEKAVTETRTRSPEERIWIAVIQQKFEDAFELGMGHNLSLAEVQRARNWFYTNDCAITCDYVGTTRDHIQKLYKKLSGRWKSGLLTKDELRFAIRRLEWKI